MKWIWTGKEKTGEYAEFRRKFTAKAGKRAELTVAADWEYAVYINGTFVANGQYADTDGVKSVDTLDVSAFLYDGENEICILAYHMGADFSVCRTGTACLAFAIQAEGKVLAESDEHTQWRPSPHFTAEEYAVTPQYGFCWRYRCTPEKEGAWQQAVYVHPAFTVRPRPNKRFTLSEPLASVVCAQGVYKEAQEGNAAERMQTAWLSARRFRQMTSMARVGADDLHAPLTFTADAGDGVYIIMDMGKETAGYLSLSFAVDKACTAMLGWGEHLSDLRLRTSVGGRAFGYFVTCEAGENVVEDYIHRLGCRYVCLFVPQKRVTLTRCTLREAQYPFKTVQKDFGDRLLNKLYAMGQRTLGLCAHVHYEDCPWREQALYGMDSRNQMLFGYGALGETELPRSSLRDLIYDTGKDGLLELCAPSHNTITIPSFSLYWVLAVCENACVDYDKAFIIEMLPYADKIFDVFNKRLHDDGVHNLPQIRYWNFHEWVDGLDGGMIFRSEEITESADAILTGLFILAANGLAQLHKRAGNAQKAAQAAAAAQRAASTVECFYCKEKGLYASFITADGKREGFHAYTQALLIAADAVPQAHAVAMCDALRNPPAYLMPCTFATLQFKYDAIMKTAGDKAFCLNEICDLFGGMIAQGATSYWETALGEADFEDAGSLCHAWAAVPCYFLDKYGVKEK